MGIRDSIVPAPLRKPGKPGSKDGRSNGPAPADLRDPEVEQRPAGEPVHHAAGKDLLGWIDQRTAATGFLTGMLYRNVPKGTNWFYTLGSATLFALPDPAVAHAGPPPFHGAPRARGSGAATLQRRRSQAMAVRPRRGAHRARACRSASPGCRS